MVNKIFMYMYIFRSITLSFFSILVSDYTIWWNTNTCNTCMYKINSERNLKSEWWVSDRMVTELMVHATEKWRHSRLWNVHATVTCRLQGKGSKRRVLDFSLSWQMALRRVFKKNGRTIYDTFKINLAIN